MNSNTGITTIAVGFYLGSTLSQFFTALTRDLVAPIIAAIFPGVQTSVDKIVVQVGSVKLNIGDAIGSVINLLIAYFVVSMTLPYIRSYSPIGGR
jgi:large-conductance mechanosensitive channel